MRAYVARGRSEIKSRVFFRRRRRRPAWRGLSFVPEGCNKKRQDHLTSARGKGRPVLLPPPRSPRPPRPAFARRARWPRSACAATSTATRASARPRANQPTSRRGHPGLRRLRHWMIIPPALLLSGSASGPLDILPSLGKSPARAHRSRPRGRELRDAMSRPERTRVFPSTIAPP